MHEPGSKALADLLGLRFDEPYGCWELRAERTLCSGTGRLFGGAAVAATVSAAESTANAPLNWVSARFVRPVRAGEKVMIQISILSRGRRVVHATAAGVVDGLLALDAQCALGPAPPDPCVAAVPRAPSPPPEDCPPRRYRWPAAESIASTIDVRVAPAGPGGACTSTVLWAQAPGLRDTSAGLVALVADHVPFAAATLMPGTRQVSTIDNCLRMVAQPQTPWLQLDVRIDAISGDLVHGSVYIWSQEGALVAIAAQTLLIR